MGVKELYALLRRFAPECFTKTTRDGIYAHVTALNDRADRADRALTLGVDANLVMFQWSREVCARTPAYVNAHVTGAFAYITDMLASGLVPVFVFDGAASADKLPTQAKRVIARQQQAVRETARLLQVFDEDAIVYTAPDYTYATALVHAATRDDECDILHYESPTSARRKRDVAALCALMGVQCIWAPGEADEVLTSACFDIIHTEDSDLLPRLCAVHLCGRATAHIPLILRGNVAGYELINVQAALHALKLTAPQFVDLCCLLGTDYNDRPRGFGPVTALKSIRKYGALENIPALAAHFARADGQQAGADGQQAGADGQQAGADGQQAGADGQQAGTNVMQTNADAPANLARYNYARTRELFSVTRAVDLQSTSGNVSARIEEIQQFIDALMTATME